MKIILFGATGMIGQGVLRECLLDPKITSVLSITRHASGQVDSKLHEILHSDFCDYSAIQRQLAGYEACFFCLGISSAGMKETDYSHITYDFTLAAARALVQASPAMTFVYVSGTGADSTELGPIMWARIKGKTENALAKLPFKATFMFRPGFIQPLHGIRSRTRLYRALYSVFGPLYPLLKRVAPKYITTTENVGKAMIRVAHDGAPKHLLENEDINWLCVQPKQS